MCICIEMDMLCTKQTTTTNKRETIKLFRTKNCLTIPMYYVEDVLLMTNLAFNKIQFNSIMASAVDVG